MLLCLSAEAQSDTLFTKKNQKIACKIFEVNEYQIKYGIKDGPMYVIDKSQVLKYTLAGGFTETFLPDELLVDNEHESILMNRSAIKVHPFSLINNQISLAYEKVIKVGMNLDVEAGYTNVYLNPNSLFRPQVYSVKPLNYNGAYIKPGLKFFLGQDYVVKGMRYAHPLKGRYLRLDLAFSYLNFQDVSVYEVQSQQYPYNQGRLISTNMSSVAFGGFVNYGRQFILGNLLTMEYYIGIGYTGQSYSYSNPDFASMKSNYYYSRYGEGTSISNYHGFMRAPLVGISGTAGFRIGYIIPDKHATPRVAK